MADRIIHTLSFSRGTDYANHTVSCNCGWKHVNTASLCRNRGLLHTRVAENKMWNDQTRRYMMPTNEFADKYEIGKSWD